MRYNTLIPLVNQILSEYDMRLTLRQIYYRLVADHNYPNRRSSYNQLSSQLVKAREEGLVDERRIEDRTRSFLGGYTIAALVQEGVLEFLSSYGGWTDTEAFSEAVQDFFLSYWKRYQLNMWKDQPEFVVIWVEKDALSRVLASVANKYRVITAPSRGYASYSYIRQAIARLPKDKKVTILHFSDHDPSGLDMTRDLYSRLVRYSGRRVSVRRIALTIDQVKTYDLIPNPTKAADTRSAGYIADYGRQCWELDAIEPKELQRLVMSSIQQHLDMEQWEASQKLEEEHKTELREIFEEWALKLEE